MVKLLPEDLIAGSMALASGIVAYYKPRRSVEAGAVAGATLGHFVAANTDPTHQDGSSCSVLFMDDECKQRQRDRVAGATAAGAALGAAVGALDRWRRGSRK